MFCIQLCLQIAENHYLTKHGRLKLNHLIVVTMGFSLVLHRECFWVLIQQRFRQRNYSETILHLDPDPPERFMFYSLPFACWFIYGKRFFKYDFLWFLWQIHSDLTRAESSLSHWFALQVQWLIFDSVSDNFQTTFCLAKNVNSMVCVFSRSVSQKRVELSHSIIENLTVSSIWLIIKEFRGLKLLLYHQFVYFYEDKKLKLCQNARNQNHENIQSFNLGGRKNWKCL